MHHLLFWHWWILAGILLVGEILSFTSFLLWIAVAAFVTGIVKFFVPTVNWQWQMVLFAILAVIGVLIALMILKNRKYLNKKGYHALNSRARTHIGKKFSLDNPIVNGEGKIKVGDTYWLIQCEADLKEGEDIEVIDAKGTTLIVKPKK